jgi:hypothetical protein
VTQTTVKIYCITHFEQKEPVILADHTYVCPLCYRDALVGLEVKGNPFDQPICFNITPSLKLTIKDGVIQDL